MQVKEEGAMSEWCLPDRFSAAHHVRAVLEPSKVPVEAYSRKGVFYVARKGRIGLKMRKQARALTSLCFSILSALDSIIYCPPVLKIRAEGNSSRKLCT